MAVIKSMPLSGLFAGWAAVIFKPRMMSIRRRLTFILRSSGRVDAQPPPAFIMGFLLALLFASPAQAQVDADISYTYYPLVVKPGQSLARAIASQSPLVSKKGQGSFVTGRASYRITYDYDLESPTLGVCRLKSYQVACPCEVTFPDLKNGDEATRHLFFVFMGYLKDHELTHCRIAAGHAGRFHKKLSEIKTMDCDRIRPYIRDEYIKIRNECALEQARYDEVVSSGKKFGLPLGVVQLEKLFKSLENEIKTSGTFEVLDSSKHGFQKGADGVWRNY